MNTKKGTDININNMSKKELLILSNRIEIEIERWVSGERRRQDVLMAASEYFDLPIRHIRGNNRNRRMTDIRKVISKVLRKDGNTFKLIGHTLDLHHASVIYSVEAADNLLKIQKDENFIDMYEGFTNFLKNEYDATGEAASAQAQN